MIVPSTSLAICARAGESESVFSMVVGFIMPVFVLPTLGVDRDGFAMAAASTRFFHSAGSPIHSRKGVTRESSGTVLLTHCSHHLDPWGFPGRKARSASTHNQLLTAGSDCPGRHETVSIPVSGSECPATNSPQ